MSDAVLGIIIALIGAVGAACTGWMRERGRPTPNVDLDQSWQEKLDERDERLDARYRAELKRQADHFEAEIKRQADHHRAEIRWLRSELDRRRE